MKTKEHIIPTLVLSSSLGIEGEIVDVELDGNRVLIKYVEDSDVEIINDEEIRN